MMSMINRVDDRRAASRPERLLGSRTSKELPEAAPGQGTGDDQALIEQGLRLNRAFIQVKDHLVREAIINLVIEAVKHAGGKEAGPRKPD